MSEELQPGSTPQSKVRVEDYKSPPRWAELRSTALLLLIFVLAVATVLTLIPPLAIAFLWLKTFFSHYLSLS